MPTKKTTTPSSSKNMHTDSTQSESHFYATRRFVASELKIFASVWQLYAESVRLSPPLLRLALKAALLLSVRPIARGLCPTWGFFHEARFANSSTVFKREIDSSCRIDVSTAFSAKFSLCFAHFEPHASRWRLILSTGLCANSRLKTSKAAIASCISIRSSLETCPPSDARARMASSAALTRSRSLLRLISKTAARYSCHQLFSIILDSQEKAAHAALLLLTEVSSSKRAKA